MLLELNEEIRRDHVRARYCGEKGRTYDKEIRIGKKGKGGQIS